VYAGALAEQRRNVLLRSGAVGVVNSRECLFDLVYQYLSVSPSSTLPPRSTD
jgi:hypothetical protein